MSVFQGDAWQHRGRDEARVNRSRKVECPSNCQDELWLELEGAALSLRPLTLDVWVSRFAADCIEVLKRRHDYRVSSFPVAA